MYGLVDMPITVDTSHDYTCWDNVLNGGIRYSSFGTSLPQDMVIPTAKRRALSRHESFPSGGAYTGLEVIYLFPQELVPHNFESNPGDVITEIEDDAKGYTVLRCQHNKNKQTWRCETVNLAILYGLRDLIDIERPEISYDAAGGVVRTWPPSGGRIVYASLSARVQLITKELADERGYRGFREAYSIPLSRQVAITKEDRIKWTDNGKVKYLDIRQHKQPDRIDELPMLEATIGP